GRSIMSTTTTTTLIKNVILDIEGTTTPISFVHDVLFPYIRSHLRQHLEQHWSDAQLQDDIATLRCDVDNVPSSIPPVAQVGSSDEQIIDSVVRNVTAQMDIDRKSTALKQLQGHMWSTAYESGQIKGVVFEDVPLAFARWQKTSTNVYIYSSGSVAAQKLLFGYSVAGNLLTMLHGHYDTNIGSKLESESYRKILQSINSGNAADNLFITDSQREALAATDAGLYVLLSVRPGNPSLDPQYKTENIPQITSFDQAFDKYTFIN
ncbi:hypothetical protein SAMD00019534_099490, partial [Acytostelium subglobosum LB1]|uniref:hypothetical protein n=1 Tax=Acytostelium subglobosum LB1 TaxID=1410327 RepID=UPI000644ADAC